MKNRDNETISQFRQLLISAIAGAATEAVIRGIVSVRVNKIDYLEIQKREVIKAIEFYNKGDIKKAKREIEKSIQDGIRHENKLFDSESMTRLRVYWDEIIPDMYGQIDKMPELEERVKYYRMYTRKARKD